MSEQSSTRYDGPITAPPAEVRPPPPNSPPHAASSSSDAQGSSRASRFPAASSSFRSSALNTGSSSSDVAPAMEFERTSTSTKAAGKGQQGASAASASGEADEKSRTAADAGSAVEEEEILPHNLDGLQDALRSGSLPQMPLQLASIRIEGASLLRRSFLESLCSPYLLPRASSSNAVTLSELFYRHRAVLPKVGERTAALGLIAVAQSLSADLTAMDVFDKVDVTLQPARDVPKDADKRAQQELSDVVLTLKNRSRLLLKSSTDVGDGEGSASVQARQELSDVVLTLKNRSRLLLKSSTDVGDGEGSASVQARVRNVFGGAEVFNGSATIGTRTRKAFNVSLTAPILANPDHIFSLGAYALDRDCTAWWAAYEGLRGARASILSSTAQGISHEFALQADWRHIGRLRPFASRSIRRLAGHSLKCSVQHTYMRDTRDDPLFHATTGSLTKVVNEVSGFGSDVHHWKGELEASRARTLGHGYAWSLGASAGLLKTLDARASHLSDRFQLGGPLSVRMFRFNSLGPKDGAISVVSLASAVSVGWNWTDVLSGTSAS
ncbi:Predicted cell surface protein homologous to bacterial outer membrane proteins [Ceraceosorus bombacis]|uniref:Predicted cell surface protein homologous to bacterial outer membrane proteins n=1 Tax=Ceraceosorus bombacis TaxID=401625 RepID=A0A0N7LBG6_9BASI|nr:Predicted cell surface protein homologous to bacterial outer membrane proteins [Ceraceosorus bombacis]